MDRMLAARLLEMVAACLPPMSTRRELAGFLGVPPGWLARKAVLRRGPQMIKMGRARSAGVRYPRCAVEDWLRAKAVPAAAVAARADAQGDAE